jgi:hypothetical protein
MKKVIIILLTIAVAAILSSYIFVPSKIKISAAAIGHTSPDAAYRYLQDDANWNKWWPGSKPFTINGIDFILTKKGFNVFDLQLNDKRDTLKTYLQILPEDKDTTGYDWTCEIESGNNPAKRWLQYFKAVRIKKTFDLLLDYLSKHLADEENVYGFKVKRTKVIDSVLLTTRRQFDHYPDSKEVDSVIRDLRKYISDLHGIEKNYPMLNVNPEGKDKYEAMVAIATEWALPPTDKFAPKLVLKNGNLLETEIKGGEWTIRKAFDQFLNYRSDYRIMSPAIPYQSIITDRAKEPDTSKWVTKLYYPVF